MSPTAQLCLARRVAGGAVMLTIALGSAVAPAAASAREPTTTRAATIRAVESEYRRVALAEFFGPTSAVCGQLTAAGLHDYSHGAAGCARVFAENQRALALKLGGGSDSAAARAAWRKAVSLAVAHLAVKMVGAREAITADHSGLFRRTHLVKVRGHWRFSSAPPLPRG